ncbi:hypothetical protein SALBM217S_05430 [Streptomyces griseoloalbus]
MAEGVVDRPEAVEVDEHERGAGAGPLGVVQRGPDPLLEPLPVGQSGQRVAQLLLGPRAGYPQGGVEGDERDGEQRQQHRLGVGDHAHQRGDAEQGDRDEPLAGQGGAGDGGQPRTRGVQVPQQGAGDREIGGGDEYHPGTGVEGPGVGGGRRLDGRHGAERGQDERSGADAEQVDRAVQHALPPAAPAGYADQHDDGEADHAGRDPAVGEQHGEGEGRAGARAAPPAGAAQHHEVADDDAGEHRQRPADRAGREEGVPSGEGAQEAGAEDEAGRRDDRGGQRGPGRVPFGLRRGVGDAVPAGRACRAGVARVRGAGAPPRVRSLRRPPVLTAAPPDDRQAAQAQP